VSKRGIYPVPLLSWLAKNGTRCILLLTSLKHAARQFGLYDPPTDLNKLQNVGRISIFFNLNNFHVTALKAQESSQDMVGNVQHTSVKGQKFNLAWRYKLVLWLCYSYHTRWEYRLYWLIKLRNVFNQRPSWNRKPDCRRICKLRRATISFFMSVSLSVHPSVRVEKLVSHWTNFCGISYLSIFFKNL
jgi:hypothetical protein